MPQPSRLSALVAELKYLCVPRIIVFVLGVLAVMTAACRNAEINTLAAELDPFINEAFALELSPGMAVAVIQGSDITYAKGFGYADLESRRPVTPETMFYIASTTKSFTAFAAMLLASRGDLDLDKPISQYLQALRLAPSLSADEISLRDLLTHTHGIKNDGPVVFRTAFSGVHTHDQLVALVESHGPAPGGNAFNYGNIGYNITSLAMDAELGMSWQDLLRREIFDPLGMASTSSYLTKVDRDRLAMPYVPDVEGFRRVPYVKSDANMHAAGGHVSTALDLATWLEAHINAGRVAGKQVFPGEVVAETHRKQADQDRDFSHFYRYGWGLGWDLGLYEQDTLIHRFGSFAGFRSHISFMPQHGTGVVVLVNEGFLGSFLADMVATYIYDKLLDKPGLDEKYGQMLIDLRNQVARMKEFLAGDKARRAARSQVLPHSLDAYAGKYINDELGQMEWCIVNGTLEASIGLLHSVAEVYDAKQNQLRVELIPARGEVVGFFIQSGRAESISYKGREFMRIAP